MLRPIGIYLVLSCIVVLLAHYLHLFVLKIDYFYTLLAHQLQPFFSATANGRLFCRIFLLVVIPVIIAAVPALIYRLIKGKDMPYFFELTWCIWLIIMLSTTLIR